MNEQPANEDAALGKAIRELWELSGQAVYIAPRDRDHRMVIAVMETRPDEDGLVQVDEFVLSAGSLLHIYSEGA